MLVGATSERLLLAAEMQEMKKPHSDGFHHEVTVQDIESFIGSGEYLRNLGEVLAEDVACFTYTDDFDCQITVQGWEDRTCSGE